MQTNYNDGRQTIEPFDADRFAQRIEQSDVKSILTFKGTPRTIAGTDYIEDEHGTLHKLTK